MRVKGPRREICFPQGSGFCVRLFPALLAGSAVTHATARTGPAPSPRFLSLAEPRRSDFLPSAGRMGMAALGYIPFSTKEEEKLLSARADGRLFPGSSATGSFFLLS